MPIHPVSPHITAGREMPFPEEAVSLQQTVLPDTERQTIVHCKIPAMTVDAVRVWQSTWLLQPDGTRKKLLHAEGITLYPDWLFINVFEDYWFTLIFEGLDSACNQFDLLEDIPEPGGFSVKGIARNSTDIYRVTL